MFTPIAAEFHTGDKFNLNTLTWEKNDNVHGYDEWFTQLTTSTGYVVNLYQYVEEDGWIERNVLGGLRAEAVAKQNTEDPEDVYQLGGLKYTWSSDSSCGWSHLDALFGRKAWHNYLGELIDTTRVAWEEEGRFDDF